MVLYYSATGNTQYIAQELAKGLDDTCVNLLDKIRSGDHSELHSDKPFIICAPIIVCEMPRFLMKYLKQQKFTGSAEVYFVFTSGGYCGVAGVLAKSIFKKKKMHYRGHAEFVMPRNYVASNAYSMLSPQEIEARFEKAGEQLPQVISEIRAGKDLTARHIQLWEVIVTVPFNPVWCKFMLRAKDFHSTEKCIGCGKCAKLCPMNNISMVEKAPKWGSQCTHCMACIGNCPTEAIEYGNITQAKDKYNFGKYRHLAENMAEQK